MKLRIQSCLALVMATASVLSAQSVDVAVLDETLNPLDGLTLNFELEDGRVLGSALAYPGRYAADLGVDKSRLTFSSDIYGVVTLDLEHGVDSDVVIILGPDGPKTATYATAEGMFLRNPTAMPVGIPGGFDNSTCDMALPLFGVPVTIPGSNLGGGIVVGHCDGLFGGFGRWYSVTGTGGTMTASTCGLSTFNSGIRVLTGCGLFDCIAGSQDGCEGNDGASVSWESEAGLEYKILVHGFLLEVGAYALTVEGEPSSMCPLAETESISDDCGAELTASLPIIGGTGTLSVESSNIFAQGFIFLGDPSVSPYTAFGCDAYVLPTALFTAFSTDSTGDAVLSFPLPTDTSFCGEQFVLQAAVRTSFSSLPLAVGDPGMGVAISNAILITMGIDPTLPV